MNAGSLLELIESPEAATRDRAVDAWCEGRSAAELLLFLHAGMTASKSGGVTSVKAGRMA